MEPLLGNVTEHEHAGMRFFASRTNAKDVVTIEGSVIGGHTLVPEQKSMSQRVLVDLLDAGTKSRSKDSLRESLAVRGANVSFSTGLTRTYFNASCLPEDISFITELIVECLTESVFLKAELNRTKTYVLAQLEKAKVDTFSVASIALNKLLFDSEHVNHSISIETAITRLKSLERKDVKDFYSMLGTSGLVFAITGDIEPEKALSQAEQAFAKLRHTTTTVPAFPRNAKKQSANTTRIQISDKATIDVLMGVSVPITEDDPLFIPFSMLVGMLGGGGLASGHLMRTVRERDGLTYGIYASPYGFDNSIDGGMRIRATFSPNTFDQAVTVTKNEIANFFLNGITLEALEYRQEKNIGSYLVGLGTSHGVSSQLHYVGLKNKPLSYIDEYPERISAVTLSELHAAAKFINLNAISMAAAGTFAKKSK